MRKLMHLGVLLVAVTLLSLPGSPLIADHQCSVNTHCSSGSTISCTGSSSCNSSPGNWVECDGNRTYCPPPSSCTASVYCDDGSYLQCTGSSSTSCIEDSCYIICDGQRLSCPGYEFMRLCPF